MHRRLRSAGPSDNYSRVGEYPAFTLEAHRDLESLAPAESYPPGCHLFMQGHSADCAFYIGSGLVKLMHLQISGRESIVALRSTGWLLGAAAVCLDRGYATSAKTITPARVSRIGADHLRGLLRTDGNVAWHLQQMHSEEIYATIARANRDALSARERLMEFLGGFWPDCGGERGRELVIDIPLRKWEIAELIGITPQYLSELFKQLESEGLLERSNDVIRLSRRFPRGDDEL